MNSNDNSSEATYSDQLSDFESQLRYTIDDESLLQDVFQAIRGLLREHRESEADIRKILRERFDAGDLRDETFEVVQRMLDRIVSDSVATWPGSGERAPTQFGDTDVIPADTLDAESSVDRLQAGSIIRDRFLLQQRIAGGSMGIVYKALDRRLAEVDGADPWVAIKVLAPELSRNASALRAMQQEAAKGRCLSHPNIVRFVDLDRDEDLYFMVMEWIPGRSLAAVLDDPASDPIDLDTALEIVRQIGRALDYAHSCGVVHADVKPGNVMIQPDGTVKLIDFGVARILQKQRDPPSRFDPAVLAAATPAYSSMQVLTGEDPVPSDDVFSLGCLMYRLVAGYRVFGPRNAAEAAEAGMAPQRPPGLSDRQWRALKKALAYSRVARYGSPKAFVDELRERGTSAAEEDEDTIVGFVGRREPRRGRRAFAVVWLAIIGIAAGAGYLYTQTDLLDDYIAVLRQTPTASPAGGVAVSPGDAGETAPASEMPAAADTESSAGADDAGASESPVDDDAALAGDFSIDDILVDDTPAPELPQTEDTETTVTDAAGGNAQPEAVIAATHTLPLPLAGASPTTLEVVLREDSPAAVIDVLRAGDASLPLSLLIEETGFSGNRSPWESGQYSIDDGARIDFAAGRARAQTSLAMMSDPLREADRQVELTIRADGAPEQVLARIRLTLEDDDQRRFEAGLPANTVAFATGQVSVGENDPVVQIDVLRFNPDSAPLESAYVVQDVTASEGEDYFAPQNKTISFPPGGRTARILIPLVQDAAVEADEAFFLEISDDGGDAEANIFRRIAVMIRDDDSSN